MCDKTQYEEPDFLHLCNQCSSNKLMTYCGEVVCEVCATVQPSWRACVTDTPDKNDQTIWADYVIKDPSYKQDAHFNEVVAQRKGEGGTVDDSVMHDFWWEYVNRGWNPYRAKRSKTKQIIKENRKKDSWWGKFNEQIIQITALLSGEAVTWLNGEQQERVNIMWQAAKVAWCSCPRELKTNKSRVRTSFPNYLDFMKRCCIYLGYRDMADSVPQLKTGPTVADINRIWTFFGIHCYWKGFHKALLPEYDGHTPQVEEWVLDLLNCPPDLRPK